MNGIIKKSVKYAVLGVSAALLIMSIYSCVNKVVKIDGDTITLTDIGMSVSMEKFTFIQQSEENSQYDEWEVAIKSTPELESAMALDMGSGGFYLTPIANVTGSRIIVEGVNGTGTNFSFKIPKGETPISYQIRIKDRVLTYHYDKKTWTYSEDDKDFKPADRMRM